MFLPYRIKPLLAYGLKFHLPIYKLDFYKYFGSIEYIAQSLKKQTCSGELSEFYEKLQTISYKFFYGFKSHKVFSTIFGTNEILLLKQFSRKHKDHLIVSPPDKGEGVVLVDRGTYLNSMDNILSNASRFAPLTDPITKYCMKIEDKINRFLQKLKKLGVIPEDTYNSLHVTGSGPGILYGLPKIHKMDFSEKFQYRPILAA